MKQRIAILNSLKIILIIIASIGLVDAGYLTVKHYQKSSVLCTISGSCEKVLNSDYSVIFGVPVAALGLFFYLIVLIFAVHMLTQKTFSKLILLWSTAGLLMTLYLLSIQAFVLNAWCQYCVLSAITATTIFMISWTLFFIIKHMNKKENKEKATNHNKDS